MAQGAVVRSAGMWSRRGVAAAAGVGVGTVRNLERLGLLGEPLGGVDVLLVRALAAAGATRSTNREDLPAAVAALQRRDAELVRVLRSAVEATAGLPAGAWLALSGTEVTLASELFPVMAAAGAAVPEPTLVLPVGAWWAPLVAGALP